MRRIRILLCKQRGKWEKRSNEARRGEKTRTKQFQNASNINSLMKKFRTINSRISPKIFRGLNLNLAQNHRRAGQKTR